MKANVLVDGGRHRRLALNDGSDAVGGSWSSLPPELSLIQLSRVSQRTVVTELARRNDGFTPGNDRKIFYAKVLQQLAYCLSNIH